MANWKRFVAKLELRAFIRDMVYLYIKHTSPENQFIGQGLYKAQVRVSSKRTPFSLLLNVPDGLALLSLEKSSYINYFYLYTTVWTSSADKMMIVFLFFPRK